MHNMVRRGQVQPDAARLQRQHHKRNILAVEPLYDLAALFSRHPAMDHQPAAMEQFFQITGKRLCHLAELGEYQDALMLVPNSLADAGQRFKFTAVLGVISSLAVELIRMIAYLLEFHQRREDSAPALHRGSRFSMKHALHLQDKRVIKRSLLFAQHGILPDLIFIREVGDNRLIRLHPPQDKGRYRAAQFGVSIRLVPELFRKSGKLSRRAQQTGVEKIKQRPQIGQPVFYRRPRHGNANACAQRLDRFGLLDAGALDGLRLIEYDHIPRKRRQVLQPRYHPIGRDKYIPVINRGLRLCPVNDAYPQARREPLGFLLPVHQQRRGNDQQRFHPRLAFTQPIQHSQYLYGFAKPHVIRQQRAKAHLAHKHQPVHARLLVGAQNRLEPFARLGRLYRCRLRHLREHFPQPLPVGDFDLGIRGHHRRVPDACLQLDRLSDGQFAAACHAVQRAKDLPDALLVDFHPFPLEKRQAIVLAQQLFKFGAAQLRIAEVYRGRKADQRLHAQHGRLL